MLAHHHILHLSFWLPVLVVSPITCRNLAAAAVELVPSGLSRQQGGLAIEMAGQACKQDV